MASIMEREDQDRILLYLNQKDLPFSRYTFVTDPKYGHMKRLGRGGGGAVYAVKNRFDQEFAVKVIGFQVPPITDPQVIRECETEVQTQLEVGKSCREIVRIEDAQVLRIRLDEDFNVLEASEPTELKEEPDCGLFLFIRMEKLQPVHTDRDGVIDRLRTLEEAEVIKFAKDIGRALRAAHNHPKRIIHRDVKPENIFWDPLTGIYKLGDFGIAKATQLGEKMTTGTGTGNYRAPEVRVGGMYDIRADIYSYGIMLYKLLDNDWFFRRDCDTEKGLPAPAHGSAGLHRIVLKACSHRPEDRYGSMDEVLAQLEQLENGKKAGVLPARNAAVKAAPVREPAPAEKPARKEPAAREKHLEEEAVSAGILLTERGNKPAGGIQLTERGEKPARPAKAAVYKAPENKASAAGKQKEARREIPAEKPKAAAEEKKTAPKAELTRGNRGDDAFAKLREGKSGDKKAAAPTNPPKSPAKKEPGKTRPKYIAMTALGILGLAALLIALLDAQVLFSEAMLPKLTDWQTYVAIALSILSNVVLWTLKSDIFIPFITPLAEFLSKKRLWTLVWFLSIGFNLYCFFGLGFQWLFLILALSLIVGSCGMLSVVNAAAVAAIPMAALLDQLPVPQTPDYGLLILLAVFGVRYGMSIMSGFDNALHREVPAFLLEGKTGVIVTIVCAVIGAVIWGLSWIPGIQMPEVLMQLHLLRYSLIALAMVFLEQIIDDYVY